MITHQRPTVAVMGAGALGSYFGGKLARAGVPVTLIGRPAYVEAVNRNGLIFESGGRVETIAVKATTDPSVVADARFVLFCVKSSDTESAAALIAPALSNDAVVLSMQNGVGNVERIGGQVVCPVAAAAVYAAATMAGPGHVIHTGGGNLAIGGAAPELLEALTALFKPADVPVQVSGDIDAVLWTKLLMNCAYNAVSALTMAPYAEMVAVPEVRAVMRAAAEEVIAVAAARGIEIDPVILGSMFDLAAAMPRTMSSTAQDIAKRRSTEIDHLNGFIAREGEALGLAVPVNRTLNALVRLRELHLHEIVPGH